MDPVYPNASLGGAGTAGRLAKYTGSLTLGNANISDAITGNVLSISGTLTAIRTWTIPDRSLVIRGVSGTQTNLTISRFDANGDQTDSLLSQASTTVTLTGGVTATNTSYNSIGSINDFLQYDVQNTSTGASAQSTYSVTADNGNATGGFMSINMNNSQFTAVNNYSIGVANDVSVLGSGNDLYLANSNQLKDIIISVGSGSAGSRVPFYTERIRASPRTGVTITGPINQSAPGQGFGGMIGVVLFGQFAAALRSRATLSPFLN